MRVEMK